MPTNANDFNTFSLEVTKAEESYKLSDSAVMLSAQGLQALYRKKEELLRRFGYDSKEVISVESQILQKETDYKTRLSNKITAKDALQTAVENFSSYSDPRDSIGQLTPGSPLLMFPLRLEARFKDHDIKGNPGKYLWVRAYPDECMIDAFEPYLTESELKESTAFWIEYYKAGNNRNLQKGAWKALASAHGPGRSHWVMKTYKPKAYTEDLPANAVIHILIGSSTKPVGDDTVISAMRDYWKKVWMNPENEATFFADLTQATTPEIAASIKESYRPVNFDEPLGPGKVKSEVVPVFTYLDFSGYSNLEIKEDTWTVAPKTKILPDRLVFTAFQNGKVEVEALGNPIVSPISVGINPSEKDKTKQTRQDGENLKFDEDMEWMVNFSKAIDKGLGFEIALNDNQAANGFEKILVTGVRLNGDSGKNKALLEELFTNQYHGSQGFSFLANGTPTNNTEEKDSGYSEEEDIDAAFDRIFPEQNTQTGSGIIQDGEAFCKYLGLDTSRFQMMSGFNGLDFSEALAMNAALWPATLGYYLESMMNPVLTKEVIEEIRMFFIQWVQGRGPIPAIRVGNQPYGILPVTRFKNLVFPESTIRLAADMTHIGSTGAPPGTQKIYDLVKVMCAEWLKALDYPLSENSGTTPYQQLMDVLGLHADSAEYHQRMGEHFDQVLNKVKYGGDNSELIKWFESLLESVPVLKELGYTEKAVPEILKLFFREQANPLKMPNLIDDVPLSEKKSIREYTENHKNYIGWFLEKMDSSFNDIRNYSGFKNNKSPNTLLFMLLHNAVSNGFFEASLNLKIGSKQLSVAQAFALKKEDNFYNIDQKQNGFSRYQPLLETNAAITNENNLSLADYISKNLANNQASSSVALQPVFTQKKALEILENTPTARLERLLAEHIDICSYRLDSWKSSFSHLKLNLNLSLNDSSGALVEKNAYIGAYGWLFNLKPKTSSATSGGYIQAPSLNHAVAAAVLRNGYLSHATQEDPGLLKVNLSSTRTREAVEIMEGIQGGQSLAALLGYRFEKKIHHNLAPDSANLLIYYLRGKFPLKVELAEGGENPAAESGQELERRYIINGLDLISRTQEPGKEKFPFGFSDYTGPSGIGGQVDEVVSYLKNICDAIADLGIAESTYQMAQGNFDRTAATLDSLSKGDFPPTPEIIQTPRTGIGLTHRVAIQLNPVLPGTVPDANATPRSAAEPALDRWLTSLLPASSEVGCYVDLYPADGGAATKKSVTWENLGLKAIDLLYMLNATKEQWTGELEDRVIQYARQNFGGGGNPLRADMEIKIRFDNAQVNYNFYEFSVFVQALRSLLLKSRSLKPQDLMLSEDSEVDEPAVLTLMPERLVFIFEGLKTLLDNALSSAVYTDLAAQFGILNAKTSTDAQVETARSRLQNQIDLYIDFFCTFQESVSFYGSSPEGGFSDIYERRRVIYNQLQKKVKEVVDRLIKKAGDFDSLIGQYNASTADPGEKLKILQQAQRTISTVITLPAPADLDVYRDDLISFKDNKFLALKNSFEALANQNPLLSGFINGITTVPSDSSLPKLLEVDLIGIDIEEEKKQAVVLAKDILRKINVSFEQVKSKLILVVSNDGFDGAYENLPATNQIVWGKNAYKGLLGEEFQVLSLFKLSADHKTEKDASYGDTGRLLKYAKDSLGMRFPVDDWLYGVARVRPKMSDWEEILMCSRAFKKQEPELNPLQLPYIPANPDPAKENWSWLALEFPKNYEIKNDTLLYTAYYESGFDVNQEFQCGLLFDEWTEVIPTAKETAALSFHFDRPNSEAPQALLLATPSAVDGVWEWADVIDSLRETIESMKMRTVQPAHLDQTKYASFVPGVVMPFMYYPLSFSYNLAQLNANIVLEAQAAPVISPGG